MKRIQTAAALLIGILMGLPSTWAADINGNGNAIAQACRADHAKHCASVRPGGGRIADCLKQHEAELSPSCQSAMVTISACANEVKKVCGEQAGSASAINACMKAHANEFSAQCRAAMPR
jgi:hypothetical protein